MKKSTLICLFVALGGSAFAQNTSKTINVVANDFYNSLELSEELNAQHSEMGNVRFDLTEFNSFLVNESSYSSKRVDLLTDPNYHDRTNVHLIEIRDMIECLSGNIVICEVRYDIYELGSIDCLEYLEFNSDHKLIRWCDLDVISMQLAEYVEEFSINDVYELIGENRR